MCDTYSFRFAHQNQHAHFDTIINRKNAKIIQITHVMELKYILIDSNIKLFRLLLLHLNCNILQLSNIHISLV